MNRTLGVALVGLSLIAFAEDKAQMPAEKRDWAIAKVTLTSGNVLVVNYRSVTPAGTARSDFPLRAAVRCPYPDRGDGTGFPVKERLNQMQQLEIQLESPAAIRLMSKTGERAREAIFHVKNKGEFSKLVNERAKGLSIECSVDVVEDPAWDLWESTVKHREEIWEW